MGKFFGRAYQLKYIPITNQLPDLSFKNMGFLLMLYIDCGLVYKALIIEIIQWPKKLDTISYVVDHCAKGKRDHRRDLNHKEDSDISLSLVSHLLGLISWPLQPQGSQEGARPKCHCQTALMSTMTGS